MTQAPDANPIQQAIGGDAGALRDLLAHHGPSLWHEIQQDISPTWRVALDADDVMQVTYLEAFLQIPTLTARDEAGFRTWLRRIAQNNLRDAIKQLQRKKRPHPARRVHAAGDTESYVTLIETLGTETGSPSRHVARQEAADAIEAVLRRLPADYARVVREYDLAGRSIDEVAGELGRSPGAVHMLRARAHDRLRALLGVATDFFTHA